MAGRRSSRPQNPREATIKRAMRGEHDARAPARRANTLLSMIVDRLRFVNCAAVETCPNSSVRSPGAARASVQCRDARARRRSNRALYSGGGRVDCDVWGTGASAPAQRIPRRARCASARHLHYLFNRAIAEGQFPVRWVDGVRARYSQPLFNFYQPGFYYLVAITHLAVPSLALSLKITVGVAWALGAVFMYLLFRPLGRLPGILAASLFICSPYILLDVFVRSAYPELAAVALAPGLLWAIRRATDRPRPGYLGALAGLTALALVCHLPTFLVFSPLFATAFAVGLFNPGRRRRALAAALACGIGAGMSAFYVIPALGELHLTRISELTFNYFDFHRHFVAPNQWFRYSWAYGASTEGTSDQMSFQIGVAQLIAIAGALAGLVWLLATRRSGATASAVIAWLAALALALFLMTAHSVVLWETVPALAYLQFPWRLLMVVTVACGAIGAYALSLVPSRGAQAAIVLAAVVGQLALVHHYARPKAYIPQAQMDIDRSGWKYTRSAYEAAFVEPGYFPAGVRTLPPPGIREWQVISGNASVTADLVTAVSRRPDR
jgi:6-pyruvoyl-tetrahydropterin synthase related domain